MKIDSSKFKNVPKRVVSTGNSGNVLRTGRNACYHTPDLSGNRWEQSDESVTTTD